MAVTAKPVFCPKYTVPFLRAVHKEFLVPPQRYSFSVLLRPLDAAVAGTAEDTAQLATAAWKQLL